MALSIRSPGGYGPSSAVIQSQVLTEFPTNFAVSFWVGGQTAEAPVHGTDPQNVLGPRPGQSLPALYNFTPLVWLGDPNPNVIDFLRIDPEAVSPPTPNFSWAIGWFRSTLGFGSSKSPRLVFIAPASDEPKQGILFDEFENDLYYENGCIQRDAVYPDVDGLNHVFLSVVRYPGWYDWQSLVSFGVNGAGRARLERRVMRPETTGQRLCVGSPAIPMTASDELTIEDLRIYALPLDNPPADGSTGPTWNAADAPWGTNSLSNELATSRGRDRIKIPLWARAQFMTVAPGAAYPNGHTFDDETGRLQFTVVTSGSLLSQAPVSPQGQRPVLGRGRYSGGDDRIQFMQAEFRGRTDSANEEFGTEGAFVGTTGTAREYVLSDFLMTRNNVGGAVGNNPNPARESFVAHAFGAVLEDVS